MSIQGRDKMTGQFQTDTPLPDVQSSTWDRICITITPRAHVLRDTLLVTTASAQSIDLRRLTPPINSPHLTQRQMNPILINHCFTEEMAMFD